MRKQTMVTSLAVLAVCALHRGAIGAETGMNKLVLAQDGQANATIVIAPSATKAAQFAAYELRHHLNRITGGDFPIATNGVLAAGVSILVGESEATRALGLKGADFQYQEYLVRFQPNALILIGRDKPDTRPVAYDFDRADIYETWPGFWDEQATLYAAYDFLENACGVRWFNSTEFGTYIPTRKDLVMEGNETRRAPTFRMRDELGGNGSASYDMVNCMWTGDKYQEYEAAGFPELHKKFTNTHQYMLAKRTANGLFLRRMRAGGEKCAANHSLYHYYQLYLEQHPDWFAQGYPAGTQPPQMCYTSTGLIAQVAQEARDYFDKGGYPTNIWHLSNAPVGFKWGENYFCIEPMDNSSFCRCADCRALYEAQEKDERPFAAYGRHSEYFFQFVNAVAKRVKETHPGKFINTLAYGSHLKMPETFTLESNVAVHFCFDANRMPYARAHYEFEEGLLREWAAKDKGRALYLWLYDTFPNEVANNGQWFAFPGFFAHTTAEQFRLFQETGVRGMFHCGFGQEVDGYVTFKLMENGTLNVDDILNDYFSKLYGPAGEALKQFYLLVEETYCNPANYPEVGGQPYAGHQSKIVAWDYLGTEARMAQLGRLVEEARQAVAAADPVYRTRLDLFDKSIWSYMVAGREHHMKHKNAPIPALTAPKLPEAGGDPAKLDWARAASLGDKWYDRGGDKPSARTFAGRLAHDGKYLYLELVDECETAKLNVSSKVFCFDDWEVFFAKQRALPYRQYAFGPTGLTVGLSHGEVNWRMNVPLDDEGCIKAVNDTKAANRWVGYAIFPMDRVVPGGVKAGEKLYMNVTRVTGPAISGKGIGIDTWVSFCSVHDVDRLAEITLAP